MTDRIGKRRSNSVEPGPTVLIAERRTARHFGSRFRRMKIIAVDEFDLADFCETQTNGRLAAAGDAHDNKGEPIRKIFERNRHEEHQCGRASVKAGEHNAGAMGLKYFTLGFARRHNAFQAERDYSFNKRKP